MCSRRLAFPVRGLAATVVLFVGVLWAAGAASAAKVDFYGAPDSGAAPLEVHFHLVGDEAVIKSVTGWKWDFGDGATSTEDYTTHEYANAGKYTVSLTTTFGDGSTGTETKQEYIEVTSGASPESTVESGPQPVAVSPETAAETPSEESAEGPAEEPSAAATSEVQSMGENLVFIHHSCGENWLNSGLHDALLAKDYIGKRNDITYGVDVKADSGRPDSLGPVPGELTDMNHWILWFNDYLGSVLKHGCGSGVNRIVMFKSCFPNSHVEAGDSTEGDPFSDWKTLANYKAVYRHPGGQGQTYEHEGHTYRALGDVFSLHPETLFIAVTAPPECWGETDNEIAANARAFNNWLKTEWLSDYSSATGLHNVAIFDWFDFLAAPSSAGSHPNQLRAEFGGDAGDSHPNETANARSTRVFASGPDSFLDLAWAAFRGGR